MASIRPGDSASDAAPRGVGRHDRAGSPRIALIERDPRVSDLASHFLTRAGFAVQVVADSVHAFEQVRASIPTLVITEILMPGLDGLSLCRRLKADPVTRAVRVLILSMLSAQARASEAGADGFLRKPISEAGLVAAVTAVLAGFEPGRPVDG